MSKKITFKINFRKKKRNLQEILSGTNFTLQYSTTWRYVLKEKAGTSYSLRISLRTRK